MKIFISWSGDLSHQYALIIKSWISFIAPNIETFVSSIDINPGERWSNTLASKLSDFNMGILCVTNENINAPWLNFEAGALSKQINESLVIPILIDASTKNIAKSPISQFQIIKNTEEDLLKLANKIYFSAGINANNLVLIFNKWWPEIKESIDKLEIKTSEATEEDKYNNLLFKFDIMREGFDIQIKQLNKILQNITNEDKLQEPEIDVKSLTGFWGNTNNSTLYYGKVINGEIYFPYIYEGNVDLPAHFFNLKVIRNKIYGRFNWFTSSIKGYVYLEMINSDNLTGGWWYSEDINVKEEIEDLGISKPNMNLISIERLKTDKDEPLWAKEYESRKYYEIYRF